MDLAQLRALLAIVDHGTFAKAAEALNLSQSTVSFHIKELEAATSARLLDCKSSPARLTDAGKTLATHARRMLQIEREALDALQECDSAPVGLLRVAASTVPAEHLLPPIWGRLLQAHPSARLDVEVSDSRAAIRAVLDEDAELAFVGQDPADRRLVARHFGDDEISLVAAPHLPLPQTLAQATPLLLRSQGSGTREAVAELLQPKLRAQVTAGSAEAVRRCALLGMGYAFTSTRSVAEDLAAGRLRVVPLEGTPVRRAFYAVWLRRRTLGQAARRLLELMGLEAVAEAQESNRTRRART